MPMDCSLPAAVSMRYSRLLYASTLMGSSANRLLLLNTSAISTTAYSEAGESVVATWQYVYIASCARSYASGVKLPPPAMAAARVNLASMVGMAWWPYASAFSCQAWMAAVWASVGPPATAAAPALLSGAYLPAMHSATASACMAAAWRACTMRTTDLERAASSMWSLAVAAASSWLAIASWPSSSCSTLSRPFQASGLPWCRDTRLLPNRAATPSGPSCSAMPPHSCDASARLPALVAAMAAPAVEDCASEVYSC
mmetsp:Transcript_32251/g.81949  ORF Transcript_32251/g.81949 Transcript_32251/m.81949 type:complete len:256 (-) Transcript_32251:582-1349(-)